MSNSSGLEVVRRFSLPIVIALVVVMAATSAFAEDETSALAAAFPSLKAVVHTGQRGPGWRRRRVTFESRKVLSASTLSLAGEYIRCRSTKTEIAPHLPTAWREFYSVCDSAIGRFAARLRLRGADVDDCKQDVWADLMRSLPGFRLDDSRGRFSSWLYTIVRSKATDVLRRQARQPRTSLWAASIATPSDQNDDPAIHCQQRAEREAVQHALSRLRNVASAQSYRVAQLRWIEQRDVQEVAALLGMTPEQVWVREHRMKRKFREVFENQEIRAR
jgi:RNA polymerase sigma factor (sigma-70 family)